MLLTLMLASPIFACPDLSLEWTRVTDPGSGCFPPNCSEGKYPMAIVPLAGFDGRLYSIGNNRVWSSVDGIRWASQPKTDWAERHGLRRTVKTGHRSLQRQRGANASAAALWSMMERCGSLAGES